MSELVGSCLIRNQLHTMKTLEEIKDEARAEFEEEYGLKGSTMLWQFIDKWMEEAYQAGKE